MTDLSGGFTAIAPQSARAFRAIMEAMARPGRIFTLDGAQGPAPLSQAASAALLTLVDATTPLHLAGRFDTPDIRNWLAFHCGVPLCAPQDAQFALGDWADLRVLLDQMPMGDPAYPDRSVTLIVAADVLSAQGARLTGPGIQTAHHLSLPETAAFLQNRARFPLGFDTLFTKDAQIAALPRSTRVEDN